MDRARILSTVGLMVVLGLLFTSVQQTLTARPKAETVTLEIHGMV